MRAQSVAAVLVVFLLLSAACTRPAVPRDPDPRNELPFGFIDFAAAGSTLGHQLLTYGWALDDGGVTEVRIFLDGHFVGRTTITESRPDLTKAYPNYVHGSDVHGWTVTVPISADTPVGTHTVVVQAVDNQGATRDIGTAYVALDR